MKNLKQCELMTVAAGIISGYADHTQLQPQAGYFESASIAIFKAIADFLAPIIWTHPYPSKKQNKEKDKEKEDARASRAPF